MQHLANPDQRLRNRESRLEGQADHLQEDSVSNTRTVSVDSRGPEPMLVAVDSGTVSFRRIEYELKKRYGEDYRVVAVPSSKWGLKRLGELKAAGEEVALVLANQWMPDMSGAEFLARARHLFPVAKRALLVEWGDERAQEHVLRSMTLGHIDYYVH